MCWTAPADVAGIRKGELRCVTSDQAAALKQRIAREAEERKAAERKAAEEKKKAQAEAKFKADAPERKKVSELLKDDIWKQRTADLQKSAAVPDKTLPSRLICTLDWVENTPDWQACMVKMQAKFNTAAPIVLAPKSPDHHVQKALEALAKGQSVPSAAGPPAQTALTKEQYDYLKANVATLQPEKRTIPSLTVVPPSPSVAVCSTFPNENSSKGNCPPPLTPKQAAAAKKRQDEVAEEYRKAEAEKKAREEAKAAEERAQEKKKEEEARARVYQVKEVDDSDCTGWAIRSLQRETWCGVRGQAGLRRCEVITITKTCERRTLLPDHCVEISRVKTEMCR
jgi:hypothetical protein